MGIPPYSASHRLRPPGGRETKQRSSTKQLHTQHKQPTHQQQKEVLASRRVDLEASTQSVGTWAGQVMAGGVTGCQGGEISLRRGRCSAVAVSFMHFSYEGQVRTLPPDPENTNNDPLLDEMDPPSLMEMDLLSLM